MDFDLLAMAPATLHDSRVRGQLSPGAVRMFMKLADLWALAVDQRRALLGDISCPTYHNWNSGKIGTLSRDQLERISLVLSIHKGLKLLFADEASAMRWLKAPTATCLSAAARRSTAHCREALTIFTPCAATSTRGAASHRHTVCHSGCQRSVTGASYCSIRALQASAAALFTSRSRLARSPRCFLKRLNEPVHEEAGRRDMIQHP